MTPITFTFSYGQNLGNSFKCLTREILSKKQILFQIANGQNLLMYLKSLELLLPLNIIYFHWIGEDLDFKSQFLQE